MDERVDFDINDALKYYLDDPKTVPTPEAPNELVDCEHDPESLTPTLINEVLNPIVDAVAENPEAIHRRNIFDTIQFLLKQYSLLPPTALSKILDLIVSSLSTVADITNADIEAEEQDTLAHHKQVLEIYAFLLQWTITAVEAKAAEKQSNSTTGGRGRKAGTSKKSGAKDSATWDPTQQLISAMDVMTKVLKLKLVRIFVTTPERDAFISLFTRPVYMVLESETRVKHTSIKMYGFKVLCISIKHHGHAFAAQTSIVQNLTYFEHLSEPMAEFMQILSEQYDYPQLAEEVLKELSNKEFNANDTKGPKSVSSFISKLSELSPRLVLKQMTLLARFMESDSYTLRCSIIEVCGNLIAMLSKEEDGERSENTKAHINVFFDVLEERFLDLQSYCRVKAIQVYIRLCDLDTKFPKRRQTAAEMAARSLEDKSSNVRRNAIKLLARLVSTHPFSVLHGGQLSLSEWQGRLDKVDAEMDALKPPKELEESKIIDTALLDDETVIDEPRKAPSDMTDEEKATAIQKAQAEAATAESLNKLQLTKRYYTEALKFIDVLHIASNSVCQLLSSQNKIEVIEAMDFFVILDAYRIETARNGIRRMLRLIWTKSNNDEGKGVQAHLMDCYKGLFFDAPDSFNSNDAANYIARNMISLTFGASPAELTSLEQLLSVMMREKLISDLVVQKLWQVYGIGRDVSKTQRRGAIIVLGMLALADPQIVIKELETCLRIGLGELGRRDLALARYTCIAIRRVNPIVSSTKGEQKAPGLGRLSNDNPILTCLAGIVEFVSDQKEWFGVAEQAISAIYALSKHPDVLCTEILKRKTKYVFSSAQQKPSKDPNAMDIDGEDELEPVPSVTGEISHAASLSQLLFIVGHVAIKQIVHLELCEMDFKRRKADKEAKSGKSLKNSTTETPPTTTKGRKKANNSTPAAVEEDQDELDLIAGTTEDDFTEAIAHIRERELLYGPTSLLSSFGPLVAELASNNVQYSDSTLQAQAALCLAKLMCISSEYCETHLALLITIMERSADAAVRSNLVVALGDMAVCFNHLLDENTDFLYRRLNDGDASVKRTCLMTLTFLILAGQVKVKGQLGEMAKCTEDEDSRIRDMSRMFFTELATKDNAVYNHFIDMFSLLAADQTLHEDTFKSIIGFLTGFIEKGKKHSKQLREKLAARLQRCDSQRQWNDVAYALNCLKDRERDKEDTPIEKLLAEGFSVVQVQA